MAQCLAALLAVQVLVAAAAGRFGTVVQFATLASGLLAAAASLHLLAEGLLEAVIDHLALAAEQMPLEIRHAGTFAPGRRPF